MAATLVTSNTFGFADGSTGHVCDLGSAPTVGQLDVLHVNSNTTVTTPSGFTLNPSSVGGQGAYVYRRIAAGSEASTVTITTSGNHNTSVIWSRWGNILAADDAAKTAVNVSSGTASPAHATGTLAATGELVLAFSAMHNFATAPTSPSWSSGYTPLATSSQGTGATAVAGFVGYRLDGGTAAESPSVSWTNAASDRYMLTLTFTASAGAATQNATASLTGAGTITSTAAATRAASASLTGTGTITATAAASRDAAASLAGTATIAATGAASRAATASLAATATITAAASVSPGGAAAALDAVATITAAASATRNAAASLVATALITVAGAASRTATTAITATATITAAASVSSPGAAAALAASATITATASVTHNATAALTAVATIAAAAAAGGGAIVHRPNTGTTARPDTGVITRPNIGTLSRANTGRIARPYTGVVTRP